jgi:hypothetical protein
MLNCSSSSLSWSWSHGDVSKTNRGRKLIDLYLYIQLLLNLDKVAFLFYDLQLPLPSYLSLTLSTAALSSLDKQMAMPSSDWNAIQTNILELNYMNHHHPYIQTTKQQKLGTQINLQYICIYNSFIYFQNLQTTIIFGPIRTSSKPTSGAWCLLQRYTRKYSYKQVVKTGSCMPASPCLVTGKTLLRTSRHLCIRSLLQASPS